MRMAKEEKDKGEASKDESSLIFFCDNCFDNRTGIVLPVPNIFDSLATKKWADRIKRIKKPVTKRDIMISLPNVFFTPDFYSYDDENGDNLGRHIFNLLIEANNHDFLVCLKYITDLVYYRNFYKVLGE